MADFYDIDRAAKRNPGSSIYNLLNKVAIEDATQTSLNTATGRTSIDTETVEFWRGVITVARAMKESRTYEGIPIPESGAITSVTVTDGGTESIKPTSSSEVWLVNGISLDNCTMAIFDGTQAVPIADVKDIRTPFYVTEKLFIAFSNGSGSEQTPSIAYHKVSL